MKGFILVRALAFALWSLGAVAFIACGSGDGDDAPGICPNALELGGTLQESLTIPETPQGCRAHQLTSDLSISEGAVLTVAAGARIEAKADLSIRVTKEGAIIAVGTSDKPILFTASDPAIGWMGLNFFNSNRSENRLEHVIVEFAGSSKQQYASEPASIALTSNQPSPPRAVIKSTIIRNGFGNGIEIGANAIVPEFTDNTIQDNAGRAAYVHGSSAHWLDQSSTFSPNASDEVFVKAFPGIDERVVWDSLDAVYVVEGNLEVRAPLTIAAGATLAFRSDSRLQVLGEDAALSAVGTAEQTILFTAYQASAGHWRGIAFSNATSEENVLEHVVVEYAGQGNQPGAHRPANVSIGYTVSSTPSRATVRNSAFRFSAGCGLSVTRNSVAISTLDANSYEGNVEDACIQD